MECRARRNRRSRRQGVEQGQALEPVDYVTYATVTSAPSLEIELHLQGRDNGLGNGLPRPVAGLLAQAGAALREAEYQAFRTLAALPDGAVDPMLWSADRFVDPQTTDALTGEERALLIERFGLFGVRLAIREIGDGNVETATGLSQLLVERSGISDLRATLDRLFSARRDVLKARSALAVIDQAVAAEPALEQLGVDAERVRAGAHELTESRYLNLIRGGTIPLKESGRAEVERLLGAEGLLADLAG